MFKTAYLTKFILTIFYMIRNLYDKTEQLSFMGIYKLISFHASCPFSAVVYIWKF